MKFIPNSYEYHVNLREFVQIGSFYRCIVPSLLPLPPLVPCTVLPVCRFRFHAWPLEVRHNARRPFTPHQRVQVHKQESEAPRGSGCGRAPSEAG